jgi:hypothetical protein
VSLHGLGEAGAAGEQQVEQVAFEHRPDHLGGHHRRLGLGDSEWGVAEQGE